MDASRKIAEVNALTEQIIGAATEVHRELGPGLLESAYEVCLSRELELRGIAHKCQVVLPVRYKGMELDAGYRMDVFVDDKVVVELKTVEKLEDVHKAQLLTYLKLSDCWLGLLLNFNVPRLRDGITRMVNGEFKG